MSNIKPQYQVTPLDDTVVRKEVVYESKRDPKTGKHLGFIAKVKEKKGGLFYSMPNGSSIMLDKPIESGEAVRAMEDISDLEDGTEIPMSKALAKNQLEHFGLTEKPRLVNMMTGEEVDERGVPVALAEHVQGGFVPNDLPAEFSGKVKIGNSGVNDSIEALE